MAAFVRQALRPRSAAATAGALVLAAFVAVGAVGVERYGTDYWFYRGFAPPHDAAYVTSKGTQQTITVASAALGGRAQQVVVYLPPGYATHPRRRYPVLYLLHGFPGKPLAFLETVRMGVVEDELVARHRARPLILVMPFGSTGQFTDKEWANGVGKAQGWETFLARDVVHAIDARYRTIPTRTGRGVAGLSEGGYGAINVAFHHPGEFGVVESWSGYERPDRLRSIFGAGLGLLTRNDPMAEHLPVALLGPERSDAVPERAVRGRAHAGPDSAPLLRAVGRPQLGPLARPGDARIRRSREAAPWLGG